MARLTATDEERVDSLWNDIYAAIDSIRQIAIDMTPQGLLFWGINSVALHVSKCGMLLTKVGSKNRVVSRISRRSDLSVAPQHIASLTPTTAQSIIAIFEDIYRASSVGAVPGSRKLYLAKLFGSLLRISARRLKAASIGAESGHPNDASSDAKKTNPPASWVGLGMGDETSMDLQSAHGSEDLRQLEAFIDDYVLQ